MPLKPYKAECRIFRPKGVLLGASFRGRGDLSLFNVNHSTPELTENLVKSLLEILQIMSSATIIVRKSLSSSSGVAEIQGLLLIAGRHAILIVANPY